MHLLLVALVVVVGFAIGIASVPSIGTALFLMAVVGIGRLLFGTSDRH